MRIVIDSREQAAYQFTAKQYEGTTTERATLTTGDYSLQARGKAVARGETAPMTSPI